MAEIRIDESLCKRDGLCAVTCVQGIFQQEEKGTVPEIIGAESCFLCGQCVAICPHDAIVHGDFPEGSVGAVKPEHESTYEQVLQLVRSRRSKRAFKDMPVERVDIEKIIEAARFAPSGHNAQGTHFVVVQDPERIREIGRLTADGLRKMVKPFRSPIARIFARRAVGKRMFDMIVRFAPELEHLARLYDEGSDVLLYNAPALLLFHADEVGVSSGTDANLALQNASLAAETVGLGCFYTGFVVSTCERDDSIAKFLSLPEHHKIYAGLALGYPKLTFRKWPERKPARVTWL